jgi:hypothetical protein
VLESGDVAQALLDYAVGNQVSVIVMGAATHGLKTQRFIATVPIKVAMDAPCTVILVKQTLPFAQLAAAASDDARLDSATAPDPQLPGAALYGDDLGPLGQVLAYPLVSPYPPSPLSTPAGWKGGANSHI